MALIAINAVIDIARNLVVLEIRGIIAAMTAGALEHRIVIRIGVARRAQTVRIAVCDWELRVLRMVECRPRPGGCIVAILACVREELRLRCVARVGRVLVISLVATIASRRQRGVVAVHVTIGALTWRHGVRPGQREGRVGVIERGVGPNRGVVTQLARSWETGCRVRRVGRACVILLVARVAQRTIQRIVAVDVTVGAQARRNRVRTGQRETCRRMIELAVSPGNRVMAAVACRWEFRSDVVHRSSRSVVVVLMATHAGRAGDVVVAVDVTIGAQPRRHGMRPGQCESCAGVIEFAVRPQNGIVAVLAGGREMRCDVVHRTGRRVVVVLMTTHARGARQVVIIVDVAVRALARWNRVRTAQRESCSAMVKSCVQPTTGVVTLIAGLREVRRNVIRIRRPLKVLEMAGYAGRAGQVVIVVDVAIAA